MKERYCDLPTGYWYPVLWVQQLDCSWKQVVLGLIGESEFELEVQEGVQTNVSQKQRSKKGSSARESDSKKEKDQETTVLDISTGALDFRLGDISRALS